jgi:SAM-dependent methyltransferase
MAFTHDVIPAPLQSPSAPSKRSFRDPAGSVLRYPERILRAVHSPSIPDFEAFLNSKAAKYAVGEGKLVRTDPVIGLELLNIRAGAGLAEADFEGAAFYQHEKIPFPSYPHEWPAEMLAAAGELTLELVLSALTEGFGLKDATPYNVLFKGPSPVFVDVISFERRNPLDPTWTAYAQFVRTTLLPLLALHEFGLAPHQIFISSRDGLDPETVYRWASTLKRLSPSFLNLVSLPKWMNGRAQTEIYLPRLSGSADQARFVLEHLLKSCSRQLRKFAPQHRESTWTDYLDHKSLYSGEQLAQKEAFVAEALEFAAPRRVLDVGANEGRFSFLAARHGASVVGIDTDPTVVGTIWRKAKEQQLDVLPLVVDLTRPTPAIGWRNQECDSFLERARDHFDLVMMLAVIHHMLVTERVPLSDIFSLTAELTRDFALIEFVSPADPMFKRIVRGREALHADLDVAAFEAAAAPYFEIVRSAKIDGLNRWLYLFRRR